MKARSIVRNNHGILAESPVGTWLVITGMIIGALLLLNTGGFTYYKIKLGFVANDAATYGCELPKNGSRTGLIETRVKSSLSGLGINPSNATITINDIVVAGRQSISVSVSSPISSLLPAASLIPQQITLSDTAVATQRYWYWADSKLVNPTGGSCTFPLLNNTGELPADGLPAWRCTLNLATKIR